MIPSTHLFILIPERQEINDMHNKGNIMGIGVDRHFLEMKGLTDSTTTCFEKEMSY